MHRMTDSLAEVWAGHEEALWLQLRFHIVTQVFTMTKVNESRDVVVRRSVQISITDLKFIEVSGSCRPCSFTLFDV